MDSAEPDSRSRSPRTVPNHPHSSTNQPTNHHSGTDQPATVSITGGCRSCAGRCCVHRRGESLEQAPPLTCPSRSIPHHLSRFDHISSLPNLPQKLCSDCRSTVFQNSRVNSSHFLYLFSLVGRRAGFQSAVTAAALLSTPRPLPSHVGTTTDVTETFCTVPIICDRVH